MFIRQEEEKKKKIVARISLYNIRGILVVCYVGCGLWMPMNQSVG